MASAKANPSLTAFDQGAGRVDVARRRWHQQVIAEPANINFGRRQWPHDDDQKVVREVTYRNPGTEPVTLDLSVDVKGPDGKPVARRSVHRVPGEAHRPRRRRGQGHDHR